MDGHRLIESGPYAYLRNPSYTGSLVTCLGFGIAVGNGLSLLVMLVGPGLAFAYRIAVEERVLAERFGLAWQGYRARRWALVPPLW
jgi:protein-S-isoprenylcysteine O-methyltransferase